MDLPLNNLQRLICHKTQQTNQPTKQLKTHSLYTLQREQTPPLLKRGVHGETLNNLLW